MSLNDTSARKLELVPLTLADANVYVRDFHRHSGKVVGAKFCIGAGTPPEHEFDEWHLHGIAIVGRPVARHFDDGFTLEVNRLCHQGEPNVGSMLYGAAWRAAKALGYHRLITYTLTTESGASLRGAGWKVVAQLEARPGWDAPSRPRVRDEASPQRVLWEAS